MDGESLVLVGATFFLAGLVKGVVGLGLPSVAMALLTATLGLPQAMALLIGPSLATNLWQALGGKHRTETFRRIWPFLLAATATVWIGGLALTRIDLAWLSALLGASLVIYAAINLAGIRYAVPPGRERTTGVAFGVVNGVLTGMTGSSVVPGLMFLQGIGLGRDALVQAMGMLFTLSTLALALTLGGAGLVTAQLGLTSVLAIVPAFAGMMAGQSMRARLSETAFKRALFGALLVMGTYIIVSELS